MSAFVVSNSHINALCNYAANNYIKFYIDRTTQFDCSPKDLQKVGQILLNTNVESVNTRYNQDDFAPQFEYKHVFKFQKLTAVQIIKACKCYEYQACELNEYEQTIAAKIIRTILQHAINELPGYEEAEWEIGETV